MDSSIAASSIAPSCPPSFWCPQRHLLLSQGSSNPQQCRAAGVRSSLSSSSRITLHVDNTAITVPMSPEAARGMGHAIEGLLSTFREKEKAERPKRWQSMDFNHLQDGVSLELFCNPNAYSNAFQAKVLVTLSDEKIKVTSEGQLSAIKADLDQFTEACV